MSDFENTVQYQAVEALRADTALRREDFEGYAERVRAQRHHEVLLKMLEIQGNAPRDTGSYEDDLHEARYIADLAYPPPSEGSSK